MAKQRWEREREALRGLTNFLAEEARGGILGEALDHAISATDADAGAAFTVSSAGAELAAERGFLPRSGDPTTVPILLPEPPKLSTITARVITSRKAIHVADVAQSNLDPDVRRVMAAQGFRSLIAAPIKHLREVLGVIVLVAHEPTSLDAEAMAFLDTVVHVVALAAERDRRMEREVGYRDQLIEAGRMASLGLLTATVAHELRGPVAALSVQLDEQRRVIAQLQGVHGDPVVTAGTNDLSEMLTDMNTAVTQIGTIIGQLLSLSRRESAPDKLDLGVVAHEALALLRVELKHRGVRLVERYEPDCLTAGRRDNLSQVVTNLVLNAVDACAAQLGDNEVVVETRVDDSRVILSVDDTGPGVPPQHVQRIFQPFFTTKERGRGTGLGLKICADVVSAHHGHIEVVNRETGGASFRVILPRMVAVENESGIHPVAHSSSPRSLPVEVRRVFVVDDDDLFTRTMRRALRPHDVRTAANASEAEMALLDPAYEPDLVLCDLGLPGMMGHALHARIKERRPELAARFWFVTGGVCSKEEGDYLRSSGCPTLLKPPSIDAVLAALAESRAGESIAPQSVATLRSQPPGGVAASEAVTIPPLRRIHTPSG